jgi:heme exporter protein B
MSRVGAVVRREVALEAAGREIVTVVPSLVGGALILAGLAFGPRPDVLAATAPGLPWLLTLFAAVPLARGVAAAEREEGCWDLLRALLSPGELLAGKVVALWLWLAATFGLAAFLVAVLFNASLSLAGLAGGVLGTLGLAALTVSFGAVLGGGERRPALLFVLLCPAGLPALLAGTQTAVPDGHALPWLVLLVAFDAIALALAWSTFPVLLEE